ncbi:hypothetical protein FPQ18DRAFT_313528 [Pyronema domesticum]|uniref:Uncharacterized protein n=1 Tax=Pyronema omphalodes (strain CBS 100304) TaxID=1076935 RepID=U4LE10_PYROM|nr:hypothetical protein FPQ18DRAFT_313528 [Pyronema domesticum]CCX30324.1 Similar to hypothetical protein [Tuber melanosporum Mel28]; acc. no. XP_002839340 [Pyronema omphalodes CBS 100304]
MKFTALLSAIILGALSSQAAAQDTTASTRYQLSVETQLPGVVYPTLMFANGSAYIGNIKYNTYSEPLLLSGLNPQYGNGFTSFHSSPTGWQTFFVYENQTRPISFTVPHSAYIPAGAATTGFGVFDGNFKLQSNGKISEKWIACQVSKAATPYDSWQILWNGEGKTMDNCKDVKLIARKETC